MTEYGNMQVNEADNFDDILEKLKDEGFADLTGYYDHDASLFVSQVLWYGLLYKGFDNVVIWRTKHGDRFYVHVKNCIGQ